MYLCLNKLKYYKINSVNCFQICVSLVDAGADINVTDIRGATPLHRAASKGNTSVVKYLLSSKDKLEINIRDAYGNTPLHLACEEDRQEEAMLLIEHGARTDIQNKDKQTALDLCSKGLLHYIKTKETTTSV